MAAVIQPFVGYAGQIWLTAYKSLSYYMAQLAIANLSGDVSTVITLSETTLTTLINAVDAIDAAAYGVAWGIEATNLQAIAVLPLVPSPTDQTFFNNRLLAYQTASPAILALAPQPPFLIPELVMPNGTAPIPAVGLLEFYEAFSYETPPIGLTAANFLNNAQAVATAFSDIETLIQIFQGTFPTQVVDTCNREEQCAALSAYLIGSFTSGTVSSNVGTTNAWNQIVTLPAMTTCAAMLTTAPATQSSQQSAAIRNALLTTAGQIALFLLTLSRPAAQQISLATLRVGETLMDLANRTLGNFERWQEIASLNALLPPYVGPVASPGVAGWGDQLLLPTPSSSTSAAGIPPSYTGNVLGTDLYVGPINGNFPTWTGDFQTITGYNNLAWALGRRLQTTLGTLIYHANYGSRIPPEVGQIQDSTTAGHIAAYGRSALLSDPRVQAVLSSTATIQTFGTIQFQGIVQPIGLGTRPTGINEVITAVR